MNKLKYFISNLFLKVKYFLVKFQERDIRDISKAGKFRMRQAAYWSEITRSY